MVQSLRLFGINKRPKIKLISGREKSAGGWGLPNFKVYYWCFVLRTIKLWLDPTKPVCWRSPEEKLVHPHRLQRSNLCTSSIKTSQNALWAYYF